MVSRAVADGHAGYRERAGRARPFAPGRFLAIGAIGPYQRASSGPDQLGRVPLTAAADPVDPGPDLT